VRAAAYALRLLLIAILVAAVSSVVGCGKTSPEPQRMKSQERPQTATEMSAVCGVWSEDWNYCLQAHLGFWVKRHLDDAASEPGYDMNSLGGLDGAVKRSDRFAKLTYDTLKTRLELIDDGTFSWDFGEQEIVTGTWVWDGATLSLLFTRVSGKPLEDHVTKEFLTDGEYLFGHPMAFDTGMNMLTRVQGQGD